MTRKWKESVSSHLCIICIWLLSTFVSSRNHFYWLSGSPIIGTDKLIQSLDYYSGDCRFISLLHIHRIQFVTNCNHIILQSTYSGTLVRGQTYSPPEISGKAAECI